MNYYALLFCFISNSSYILKRISFIFYLLNSDLDIVAPIRSIIDGVGTGDPTLTGVDSLVVKGTGVLSADEGG